MPSKRDGLGGDTNPVNADRLWTDRVNNELLLQRMWNDEFGFMMDALDDKTMAHLSDLAASGGGGRRIDEDAMHTDVRDDNRSTLACESLKNNKKQNAASMSAKTAKLTLQELENIQNALQCPPVRSTYQSSYDLRRRTLELTMKSQYGLQKFTRK